MTEDKPLLLSQMFVGPGNICQKINAAIPDASAIVSVIHERDEVGHLEVTVYYRG